MSSRGLWRSASLNPTRTHRTLAFSRQQNSTGQASVAKPVTAFCGWTVLAVWGFCACSDASQVETPGQARQPIINGELDTEHDAVVALEFVDTLCTGTIISTDLDSGLGTLLTAAHCVDNKQLLSIAQGSNLRRPQRGYTPIGSVMHPQWIAGDELGDFALVQFDGADQDTPVIPIINLEQANSIAVGSIGLSVGYGVTDASQSESGRTGPITRQQMQKPFSEVETQYLVYDQTQGPAVCFGDSGGPVLFDTSDGLRVAAVHSYTTSDACDDTGVSVRVSAALDFITGTHDFTQPQPLSCGTCTTQAQTAPGACASIADACANDASCDQFRGCIQDCTDAACAAQCYDLYPTGAQLNLDSSYCLCGSDACGDICAACQSEPACGFDLGSNACAQCSTDACCKESLACAQDAQCLYCTGDSCKDSPVSNAWDSCLEANCSQECGTQTAATAPTFMPAPDRMQAPPAQAPEPTAPPDAQSGASAQASDGGVPVASDNSEPAMMAASGAEAGQASANSTAQSMLEPQPADNGTAGLDASVKLQAAADMDAGTSESQKDTPPKSGSASKRMADAAVTEPPLLDEKTAGCACRLASRRDTPAQAAFWILSPIAGWVSRRRRRQRQAA